MSHTIKLWERVLDCRVREEVTISKEQRGFMPGRSTTEVISALRQLYVECNEKQRPLHGVFVDLEKAYDTVPCDLVWTCLRKNNCPEKYIRDIQAMYEDSQTCIRCVVGTTNYFPYKSWAPPRLSPQPLPLHHRDGCTGVRGQLRNSVETTVCR